jgi:hypothetical protein
LQRTLRAYPTLRTQTLSSPFLSVKTPHPFVPYILSILFSFVLHHDYGDLGSNPGIFEIIPFFLFHVNFERFQNLLKVILILIFAPLLELELRLKLAVIVLSVLD